jgi:enoyl-CoA hydratase
LNHKTVNELKEAFQMVYEDREIKGVILTGAGEKAFVAGADISEIAALNEMNARKYAEAGQEVFFMIENCHKPVIAAINGFALGGGCELTMTYGMLIASETAQFGQPEINTGTMPGAGCTQRLPRAVCTALAMELVLTGKFISANEALQAGLINRVVPVEVLLKETISLAKQIAQKSPIATQLAKESVNKAFETTLDEGLQFERKNFYLTFASEDQKEGMAAFVEKRKPEFKGK